MQKTKKKVVRPQKPSKLTKKRQVHYFSHKDIFIYKDDILNIDVIPRSSIDLIVTSPPYNVDIHYNANKDDISYDKYLDFSKKWLKKCYQLAKDDGRFCLNIPLDKNKGGQQAVCADITNIARKVGWNYHSTIVWNEGNISRRTAWGSWMSASAPYVIAPVEVILVLYKKSWKKTNKQKQNDITKQEFMEWTNGVWTFNGQSKKGAGGHPAAFPIELPKRCIKLFSFVGDTVFDPFLGSGSTLIAASLHKRKGIGVDIDKTYCDIAVERLQKEAKLNKLIYFNMLKKDKRRPLNQLELLMEYFKKNPNRDISHPEVVDWAVSEWKKRTGKVFRDPDRGIRRLHQDGYLIKIKKGVYHYNPDEVKERQLENFTEVQKSEIFKRDNYKCVVCGRGKKHGMDIHADHIKPKELGGKATIDNGQTLCSQHNFLKKTLKQTETGKKMFIRLYELAKKEENTTLINFCADVLQTYEAHDINGHIEWKK